MKYKVEGRDLEFFPIKSLTRVFGWTTEAIRAKERRGALPPARFRSPGNRRMYLPEEIAMIEYVYREVWPKRNGVLTPAWVTELVALALYTVQELCIQNGKVENEEELQAIHKKYREFSTFKALLYIKHWRSVLLKEAEEDEGFLDWLVSYE